MTVDRRWLWLALGLLLGSVALNVVLARRAGERPAAAAPPPAPAERARRVVARESYPTIPEIGVRPERSVHERAGAAGDGGADELSLRRDILCDLAIENTRLRWEERRDEVLDVLRQQLADWEKQKRNTVIKVAEVQRLLGLTNGEALALYDGYANVRNQRVGAVRTYLAQDPPDWTQAFDQVSNLYTDQEQIVRDRFGETRARKLHDAEREERLVLLSIMATMAGRPLDDALRQ
ncbi:MAG TPA: hypothetical protein VGQ83_30170 [Polyangia bacterium]|jgi:hypothetical protein